MVKSALKLNIPPRYPCPRVKIGLLGGSFNPAHDGHVYISAQAQKQLGLQQVWWLVSPQNPLKSVKGMAPLADRLRKAQETAANLPFIRVTAIEKRVSTRYTFDTLRALKRMYPHAQFVWLMGADNLENFHRWRRWKEILNHVPVAVAHRGKHSYRALGSITARRFANNRVNTQALLQSGGTKRLPRWAYLFIRHNPLSATELRKRWHIFKNFV